MLNLNFPQIYVVKRPLGYVDPSLWDNGIPAALLSYDLNGWHSENSGSTSESAYAGLRYGLNMGPWRLRSRGSLNWDKDNGTHYSSGIFIFSVTSPLLTRNGYSVTPLPTEKPSTP